MTLRTAASPCNSVTRSGPRRWGKRSPLPDWWPGRSVSLSTSPPDPPSGRTGVYIGLFGLDAVLAVVIGLMANKGVDYPLDSWYQGAAIAVVSVLGVRSTGVKVGEVALGLQKPFDKLRDRLRKRADNLSQVAASGNVQNARLALAKRDPPISWVAQRLTMHIDQKDFSSAEAAQSRADVQEQLNDTATPEDQRMDVLVRLADQMGGNDLLDDMLKQAALQPWEEQPPAPNP